MKMSQKHQREVHYLQIIVGITFLLLTLVAAPHIERQGGKQDIHLDASIKAGQSFKMKVISELLRLLVHMNEHCLVVDVRDQQADAANRVEDLNTSSKHQDDVNLYHELVVLL